MFMNDSPKWFQRRYSSMIWNILSHIPLTWPLQIYHYNSSQFFKGLDLNPGLMRQAEKSNSRIRFKAIPKHIKKKTKNKHMLFLTWIWENMPSEFVLLVGGNHVLCSNSPHTLQDIIRGGEEGNDYYDYIGAPWQKLKGQGGGGGISFRNVTTMLRILRQAMNEAEGAEQQGEKLQQPQQPVHLNWGDEDHFFVEHMIRANSKSRQKIFHLPPAGVSGTTVHVSLRL